VLLPDWDADGKKGLAKAMGLKADSVLDIESIPEVVTELDEKTKAATTYRGEHLQAAARSIDIDRDGKLSRTEWQRARSHDWPHIWLWPAIAALLTCALFWVGFRPPVSTAN
jgi:hypothetical protein